MANANHEGLNEKRRARLSDDEYLEAVGKPPKSAYEPWDKMISGVDERRQKRLEEIADLVYD